MRAAALAALLALWPAAAAAQELDPGAYWALPTGLNVLTVMEVFSTGDVTFDPSLPVERASARVNLTAVVWTHSLAIAGRSANLSVQAPLVIGRMEGLFRGEPASADRLGMGDPRLRLAINLHGAPAMTSQAFAGYRLHTVVGASVTVVPPLGQYDSSRYINIGSNRWGAKPEIGISRAIGRWVLDFMGGVWVFSDNGSSPDGATRSQEPILSTQIHVTYRFRQNLWLAGDANFYAGGRTSIDGEQNTSDFRNSRVGATFSAALNRRSAIRASFSFGAITRLGGDFVTAAAGYNYAW